MTPEAKKKHFEVCECLGLLRTHAVAIAGASPDGEFRCSIAFEFVILAAEKLRDSLAKGETP